MMGIKNILFGLTIILFGILLELADSIWMPVIGSVELEFIGFFAGLLGIVIAIMGWLNNKNK